MTLITNSNVGLRAYDENAQPVAGALFRAYRAGTTTPATIYADAQLAVPHPTPLVADASGVFSAAYAQTGQYKFDVTTPNGASLPGYPVDNVSIMTGASNSVAIDQTPGQTEAVNAIINAGITRLKEDNGPLVIVATGQSNALGSNDDTTGDNTTTNANVKVWDWSQGVTGEFVTSTPDVYPPYGDSYSKTNNFVHWFGLKMYELTGRQVYIIIRARGSSSIIEWTPDFATVTRPDGNAPTDLFAFLDNEVQQALGTISGKTSADLVLFHQGEADATMPVNTYRSRFYQVYNRFKATSWFDQEKAFICGELADGTIYDTQNALHSTHSTRGNRSIITALTKELALDNNSGVHFSGQSLQTMGYERYANAWLAWLGRPASLDTGDIYKTYGNFFSVNEIDGRPVAARTLTDVLATVPDGLRSNTSPYTPLEGKIGYRTFVRGALTDGQGIPSDMPGGHLRVVGTHEMPSTTALGYTVTLTNTGSGRAQIIAPNSGAFITLQGNVGTLILLKDDSVTLVSYSEDGSSWFVTADNRTSKAKEVSVADDAVAVISPLNNAGLLVVTTNPNANSPDIQMSGGAAYDVGSGPNAYRAFGGIRFDVVATDVTGTTGADGRVTVGVVPGQIKIENRTGNQATFRYQPIA